MQPYGVLRTFICIVLPALLFSSCDQKKQDYNGSSTVSLSDSVNFIRLEDAKEFLPGWSRVNAVVYHTIAEPDMLHPTNGTSAMRTEINQYTQMFLVQFDFRKLEIAPGLLSKMPEMQNNGTRYDCELREEPRWDDGTPVTANDVVFTAMASKCPVTDNPHAKPYWDNLKEIIPDPSNNRKFTVVMKTPYMHNLIFWADWPIMQQKFYDKNNALKNFTFENFNDSSFKADQHPDLLAWANEFNSSQYSREIPFLTGAGMYKVASWDPGQSVTLVRKENHWTKNSTSIYETSYPEKIIYRVNKDPNSQLLDFKSQVMDGTNLIATKILLELQADSNFNRNYHSRFTETFNYTYIGMNMRPDGNTHKKIFTDKKVRRAMALLTPVDDLNKVINRGKNKRMIGPVSALKKDFDPSLKPLPYDPQQAKQLLAEAGWSDTDGDNILDKVIDGKRQPFEFTLNYMTNTPDWKDYAVMLTESYAKAGIKVNQNPLDFSVFVANAKKHDFDMMIAVWGQTAMPEDFTQLWHTTSWTNEGSNYPGFGDKSTDALIDSIKITLDEETRRPMVRRFQQIVYDEQPMIFLFSSLRRNVIHKRFGNVEMYFERPGILLNNLKLLATEEVNP
jgi:ABC-type transport system substrate-binding protein